jgi:hypothetical protein
MDRVIGENETAVSFLKAVTQEKEICHRKAFFFIRKLMSGTFPVTPKHPTSLVTSQAMLHQLRYCTVRWAFSLPGQTANQQLLRRPKKPVRRNVWYDDVTRTGR